MTIFDPLVHTTALREELCEWLSANHINPDDVPMYADLHYADGQLSTTVVRRDADGRQYPDPFEPNSVATEPATFTIAAPPSARILAWLADR